MKYIDADKLKEEIERFSATEYGDNTFGDDVANGALYYVLEEIIPSLQKEQPEVDLEKDVESWFFNGISSKINVEHTMYYYFQECARRYYERGFNVQKGE